MELPIATLFVKRKIQKEHPGKVETEQLARSARFGSSNQSLELAQKRAVLVKGSLFFKLIRKLIQSMRSGHLRWTIDPDFIQKTDRHPGFIVGYAKIAGSKISKSHLMLVTPQSMERSSHPQFGIQRLRPKNQDPFLRRLCGHRPVRIIRIRLSTWPAGDGVLKFVEDPDVQAVGRTRLKKKRRQAIFSIIFVAATAAPASLNHWPKRRPLCE